MEAKDDSLEYCTISALLSYSETARHSRIQSLSPKFSSPLKTNFENRNLWLRFGLSLSLSQESPRSALQAFNECLRIDQYDPLPAMLAAKIMLQDLDDPNEGLVFVDEAIQRCLKLCSPSTLINNNNDKEQEPVQTNIYDKSIVLNGATTTTTTTTSNSNHLNHSLSSSSATPSTSTASSSLNASNKQASNNFVDNIVNGNHSYLEAKCCYKNITPLLSKCYLLASIMHAHIYEREPESIKQFKISNLKNSLHYLDLANKTYSNDYLIHFHRALYEAKHEKSYSSAIDNIRQAIKLNPHHVPSMQLLILLLSALKLYNEALILCESTLHEFEDNLLLLYIKCNLEQCLVETKGYKSALNTAQHILKCIRRFSSIDNGGSKSNSVKSKKQLIDSSHGDSGQFHPNQQQSQPASINITVTAATANNIGANGVADTSKQATNLFAENNDNPNEQPISSNELSAWLLVAEIFIKLGSINDAELCVDEGTKHANGALSYQIMYIRGLIAKAKNNLLEAKNFFQTCLALFPRHSNALQHIGHVHHLLGNHSTAEKFLKDSLDLDSDNHKSWYYLSLVFIEANQHDKANECMKKANALEESSPVVDISVISSLVLE